MDVDTPGGTNLKCQRIQQQMIVCRERIPNLIINLNIDQDVVIANDVKDNGLSNNKNTDQVLKSHQKLPSKRPQAVINNYPKNQKTFARLPVIPGKVKYIEAVKAKSKPGNTLFFYR